MTCITSFGSQPLPFPPEILLDEILPNLELAELINMAEVSRDFRFLADIAIAPLCRRLSFFPFAYPRDELPEDTTWRYAALRCESLRKRCLDRKVQSKDIGRPATANSVCFTLCGPGGQTIGVTFSHKGIELSTRKLLQHPDCHRIGPVGSDKLFSLDPGGKLKIWDPFAPSGSECRQTLFLKTYHSWRPISSGQKIFAYEQSLGRIKAINLTTLSERTLSASSTTQDLCVTGDSRLIAIGDKGCEVWDLDASPGQELVKTMIVKKATSGVEGRLFTAVIDRDRFVTGYELTDTLRVWDISQPRGRECIAKLRSEKGRIYSLAINQNNEIIGYGDNYACVWNLGEPWKRKHNGD